MHVCILTHAAHWGGAEIHTAELADRMAGRGHRVSLVALGHDVFQKSPWKPREGVELVPVELPGRMFGLGWRQVRALLRPLQGDVCLLVKPCYDGTNWRMELAPRLHFRRFLSIEHCAGDPLDPFHRKRYFFGLIPGLGLWWHRRRFWLWSRSWGPRKIICVSDGVKNRLTQEYLYPSRKVVTIVNGINAERFHPDPEGRRAARASWKVPPTATVFGAVGRLAPMKGHDTSIEGFRRLRAALPDRDLWLVLVGNGPDLPRLQEQARASGLGDRILFPGFTDRPWEAVLGLDYFVMPSTTEGLPLALLEAMAAGCCPLAMGVGGLPEVLTDPGLGWLVPPEAKQEFYQVMRAAADQTEEGRAAMSRRVRDSVLERFDARRQYDRLIDFIEAN